MSVVGEPRPLTARELAAGSIRLAFSNYWTLVRSMGFILLPTFVIGGVALGYWRDHQPTTLDATGPARAAELVAVAVGILGNLFAQAVGVHAAASAAAGVPSDWRRSMQIAARHAGSVLTVGVSVAVLSGIGLFLFVIPGVFLWISWIVAIPAVVLEHRRLGAALRRSMELVRGRWWAVLGGYVLVELFLLVCTLPVDAIATAVAHSSTSTQAIADQVASAFVEIALIPVVVAFVALVFLDLRLRKDGASPSEVLRISDAGEQLDRFDVWVPKGPSSAPTSTQGGEAATNPDPPPRPVGWPSLSPKPPFPSTPASPAEGAANGTDDRKDGAAEHP